MKLWVHIIDLDGEIEREVHGETAVRAQGFLRPQDRRDHLVCHGALRALLNRARGADVGPYLRTANAKPYVEGGPHFNLAHEGRRGVIGLSWDGPIGVGVRPWREVDEDVVEGSFSSAQKRWVGEAEPSGVAFTATLVAKEALLKRRGTGLVNDLAAVPTPLPSHPFDPRAGVMHDLEDGQMAWFEAGEGHLGCWNAGGRAAEVEVIWGVGDR